MHVDFERLGPDAQEQVRRKLGDQAAKKAAASKYRNIPDTRTPQGGKQIKFKSRLEARRFDELLLRLRAGRIRKLKLQPQFTLQEAYTAPNGEHVAAIRYVADFSYEERPAFWRGYEAQCPEESWLFVVEDVKSRPTKTKTYVLKKKLMLERFGIKITEVCDERN